MGTATSRAALALIALAVVLAGCGGSGNRSSSPAATSGGATGSAPASTSSVGGTSGSAAFSWLRPAPAPASWHVTRIRSGAELAYPASWQLIKGDPGTATAALRAHSGRYLGYLNITPKQGEETLANWRTFRVHHNLEEGDRTVTQLAFADGVRFLRGHGSCVKDAYVTATGARYIEIACLVAGAKASTVIVGAGPPSAWPQVSPAIERAISGFRT